MINITIARGLKKLSCTVLNMDGFLFSRSKILSVVSSEVARHDGVGMYWVGERENQELPTPPPSVALVAFPPEKSGHCSYQLYMQCV